VEGIVKKNKSTITICEGNNQNFQLKGEGNDKEFSDSIIRDVLKLRFLDRLSNYELWIKVKEQFNIESLDSFFSNCFEYVQAYGKALQGEVDIACYALKTGIENITNFHGLL
jgi:hypothetical protein